MSYEQTIYNQLRKHGITEAGALGCLGNFYCESNCEPFRLQGDFSPYRTASKAYVQGVTNGSISRQVFGNDQKGFGIYQLTLNSRKLGYYDYWKSSGKALDDAALQADYAVLEMKRDFPNLFAFLKATTDIFTACSRVCREFERPFVNNIDARYSAAKRIQAKIDLNGGGADPEPAPTPTHAPQPTPSHEVEPLTLRTTDKNCSGLFAEIYILKALLFYRSYFGASPDCIIWNEELTNALKKFQEDAGLTADCIAGKKTWDMLLKR